MKVCANVSALARELGIRRKWLYKWKQQIERQGKNTPAPPGAVDPRESAIKRLRERISEMEQVIGQQTLEIRFFKKALRHLEETRQKK
jgi:transposase-like protein